MESEIAKDDDIKCATMIDLIFIIIMINIIRDCNEVRPYDFYYSDGDDDYLGAGDYARGSAGYDF